MCLFSENMAENPEPEMVFVKEELEPLLMLKEEPDEDQSGRQGGRKKSYSTF